MVCPVLSWYEPALHGGQMSPPTKIQNVRADTLKVKKKTFNILVKSIFDKEKNQYILSLKFENFPMSLYKAPSIPSEIKIV